MRNSDRQVASTYTIPSENDQRENGNEDRKWNTWQFLIKYSHIECEKPPTLKSYIWTRKHKYQASWRTQSEAEEVIHMLFRINTVKLDQRRWSGSTSILSSQLYSQADSRLKWDGQPFKQILSPPYSNTIPPVKIWLKFNFLPSINKIINFLWVSNRIIKLPLRVLKICFSFIYKGKYVIILVKISLFISDF